MIYANINLNRVLSRFCQAFESTFCTNKKAHFDCVPPNLRVVDGAKSRWCYLILIDGLICLSELREINEISRRSFNQQQILLECIVEELERTAPDVCNAYRLGKITPSEHVITTTNMEHPWNDVHELRRLFLSDPTTKSKEKFMAVVESLLGHTVVVSAGCDFDVLFLDIVHKVLFSYPQLSGPSSLAKCTNNCALLDAPHKLPGNNIKNNSSSSGSFDIHVFDDLDDDLACSELATDVQAWDFLLDGALYASVPPERPTHPLSFLSETSTTTAATAGEDAPDCPSCFVFKPIIPAALVKPACLAADSGHPQVETSAIFSTTTASVSIDAVLVPFPCMDSRVWMRRAAFGPAPVTSILTVQKQEHQKGASVRMVSPTTASSCTSTVADHSRSPVSSVSSANYHAVSRDTSPITMVAGAVTSPITMVAGAVTSPITMVAGAVTSEAAQYWDDSGLDLDFDLDFDSDLELDAWNDPFACSTTTATNTFTTTSAAAADEVVRDVAVVAESPCQSKKRGIADFSAEVGSFRAVAQRQMAAW